MDTWTKTANYGKISQTHQRDNEDVEQFFGRMEDVFKMYSGLQEEQDPNTAYQQQLKQALMAGFKPSISDFIRKHNVNHSTDGVTATMNYARQAETIMKRKKKPAAAEALASAFAALAFKHFFIDMTGLNSYLKNFCRTCLTCCKNNAHGNLRPQRRRFPTAQHPFQFLHMDFIELSPHQKYKYCLVLIDPFSKWAEIVPSTAADAITVAKAIFKTIIPQHGIPEVIYSDNGAHFVNAIISQMAKHLGITLKNHCSYHPQSAGLVERTNDTIKNRLRKTMAETGRPWTECLDLVKLYMRITPTAGHGLTPVEIINRRPFVLPVLSDIKENMY